MYEIKRLQVVWEERSAYRSNKWIIAIAVEQLAHFLAGFYHSKMSRYAFLKTCCIGNPFTSQLLLSFGFGKHNKTNRRTLQQCSLQNQILPIRCTPLGRQSILSQAYELSPLLVRSLPPYYTDQHKCTGCVWERMCAHACIWSGLARTVY
jgi:hypothetical protein